MKRFTLLSPNLKAARAGRPAKRTALAGLLLLLLLLPGLLRAQVSPPVLKKRTDHSKQIIGYLTQWGPWKDIAGLVPKGSLNQLNVDYSQYTMLNFSFFGVAVDGSIHSGDYRNPNIAQAGVDQQPAPLVDTDIYSSWDLYLLQGELDVVQYIADGSPAYNLGYRNATGGWSNVNTGATGAFPLAIHKQGGRLGLIDLAHQNGVKALASVGGWSMGKHFGDMAADPVKRGRFVADCKKLIAMGFDGIDLDWEFPGQPGMNFVGQARDYGNFAVLVEDIRAGIGAGKLITAAFSAAPDKFRPFDWARLSRSMDYFNFMTYDFNGGWSNKAGHNSPLYDYPGAEYQGFSLDATTKAIKAAGIPLNKTTLGVAFYGRGVVTSGPAALNAPTVKRAETVSPDGNVQTCADFTNWPKDVWDGTPNYQAVLANTAAWTEQWDDNAKVPYRTNGSYFLSYDNEKSIGLKAQYVKDQQLAGVIVWSASGDWLNLASNPTTLGGKLVSSPNTTAPLVNKLNEVFAAGATTPSPTPTAQAVPGTIQGESFTAQSGTQTEPTTDAGGGLNVSYFDTNDYLDYSVNVATAGSYKVEFRVASASGGATLQLRNSAGTSLGSITVGNTGGWQTWQTIPMTVTLPAGTQTLRLFAQASTGCNVNYFAFSAAAAANKAPTVSLTSPAASATFAAPAAITLTASAADADGTVSKVEFYQGSTLLGTATAAPYSYTWTGVGAGTYSLTAKATDNAGATTTSAPVSVTVTGGTTPPPANTSTKVIVGYFQNWNIASAPYIRLRDVDARYNVIDVAFAVPAAAGDMTMTFAPTQQTKTEFIADMRTLQGQGRKVLISIGGADAPVELNTTADKDKFVASMKALITDYGFDGFDIDLEGTSVILNSGDTNFKSSTTPKINNLVTAARELTSYFRGQGKDFWLTSAPEVQYVQGGYGNYGSAFGGYLPILYGLRDVLTFVHVQYYNTGSQNALDDKVYAQGNADFIVSMTDMLLRGFPVARNAANVFPALRQDQVAFGLPATGTGAAPAGGYVTPADVTKALNYLVKGVSYGGQYALTTSYPNLRGIMTWSINWDKTQGNAFVANAANFFGGTSTGGGGTTTNTPPTVSLTSPAASATFTAPAAITLTASAADAGGTVSKVEFYQGTTLLGTAAAAPYSYTWTGVGAGTYSLTAKATDNAGATTTSAPVSVTVTGGGTCTAPAWSATAVYVGGNQASRNGNLYTAKWWTQGEDPATTSCPDCVWKLVGPCGATAAKAALTAAQAAQAAPADLTLYPNPATDRVQLQTTQPLAGSQVEVLNAWGQVVLKRAGASGSVDVSGLPAGLYTLRLTAAGRRPVTSRFAK